VTTILACSSHGSGGSGSASLSGTVDNTSFTVGSAVAWTGGGECSSGADGGLQCTGQSINLVLANRPGITCTAAAAANGAENLPYASFDFVQIDVINPTEDVAPGSFGISTVVAPSFEANFGTTSATCDPQPFLAAASGTVTLTQVSSSSVTGSFDITFGTVGGVPGTGGELTGSFNVPVCDLAGTSPAVDAGAGTCIQ